MADTYNYAYDHDHTQETSYDVPGPPNYYMSIIRPEQPPMPKPTVSSMGSESSNTAKYIDVVRTSGDLRIPLCRIFLIIVASLIDGGAIGGTISYLATRPGIAEGSSRNDNSASQWPTNHTRPTCQTCPAGQTCSSISEPDLPVDCQEVMDRGNMVSGEYMISPLSTTSRTAFPVWCDMETDGGGWTVFQRRIDGSVDFFLRWHNYVNGFGDVNSEHWLGNQKIHQITSQGDYELRIDMADFEGNDAYATYSVFKLGGTPTNYMLTVGHYHGDAGDSLSYHDNQPFTTQDVDNDATESKCAILYKGAWWYKACHSSHLNGLYLGGNTTSYAKGVIWKTWKGEYYSLKVSVMKMRRVE